MLARLHRGRCGTNSKAMTLVFPDAMVEAFRERVAALIGMRLGGGRTSDLLRALKAVAASQGDVPPQAALARWLAMPAGPRHAELLARSLCVGETYFFRDPAAFRFIEEEALPALIEQRCHDSRRIRLWSAGCSTGEECYSLAIALHRALPDIARWDVSVLGTDIHPDFIERAREGVYGEWSFRGVPPSIRELYFEPIDGQLQRVRPFVRELVRFEPLNIAQDFPARADVDIITCRYVLMYFGQAEAARTVARLRDSLSEGGWLVVSVPEAGADWYEGFEPRRGEARVALRKAAAPPVVPRLRLPPSAPRHRVPEAQAAPQHPDRMADALVACELALLHNRCDPALHCLHALLLEEEGVLDKAREALRRALFLDPDFALAHAALGRLNQRLGRRDLAARHFDQLLRACARGDAA